MLHDKFGSEVFEKKMLMDNDGQQPIAICHLSDSGDLKKEHWQQLTYKHNSTTVVTKIKEMPQSLF